VTRPTRVLLLFLDGVGIGEEDPEINPFVRAHTRGLIPSWSALQGGSIATLQTPRRGGPAARAFPLDARLDTDGTPQSGTGQVALLTGKDAAKLHGSHFGPWTPVALRPLVEEESVLKKAADAGRTVAFANAYPRGWPGKRGSRRVAGPPLAAQGAGVLTRHEEALGSGDALSSEIVNDGWQRHLGHDWLPTITPRDAGANLARIASQADLTLYAHYATDSAGHEMSLDAAIPSLVRVEGLLAGLLTDLGDDVTLLVASDHGNLEDVRVGHTRNPVLGLAMGPHADAAAEMTDLRDVTPFILGLLGIS
jgi:2,3-bisphosphoglycerate-independent phosphoglycerate mutase